MSTDNYSEFKQFYNKFPELIAKSNLSQEERYSKYQNAKKPATQMQDPIRLAAIRGALKSLKQKNQKYREHFQLNKSWRKIYNGLLSFGKHQQLPKLVNLRLCEASGIQKSYFDPFAKNPVSICYNKINRYEQFQKQMLFNLILHYDNKTKSQTNWNQLQPTAISVIRALNISGLCEKQNKQCFQDQLKWRVFNKQRFQGIKVNFDDLYDKGIQNYEPISQIIFEQK